MDKLIGSRRLASGLFCVLPLVAGGVFAAGCVHHHHDDEGHVVLVDEHGYRHEGYYDRDHHWHGGWYDEHHAFHDDPHDWRH